MDYNTVQSTRNSLEVTADSLWYFREMLYRTYIRVDGDEDSEDEVEHQLSSCIADLKDCLQALASFREQLHRE